MIEVIVNWAMGRGEFLKRGRASKPRHGLVSSSEGLMRIFGAIVEPLAGLMAGFIADLAQGGRIRQEPVCHDHIGATVTLHRLL